MQWGNSNCQFAHKQTRSFQREDSISELKDEVPLNHHLKFHDYQYVPFFYINIGKRLTFVTL